MHSVPQHLYSCVAKKGLEIVYLVRVDLVKVISDFDHEWARDSVVFGRPATALVSGWLHIFCALSLWHLAHVQLTLVVYLLFDSYLFTLENLPKLYMTAVF